MVSSEDPRHAAGRLGERLAAEHLERLGFALVERNARTRYGELDIIACDGRVLVFAEVKTRRGENGRPFEALDPHKQKQVRRMATQWLVQTTDRPWSAELRFDAIGIILDGQGRLLRLEHLEGAF